MALKLALHLGAPVRAPVVTRRTNRRQLVVRASDDEDIVPIITGRKKSGFTPAELEMLHHPTLLGGKTLGEELTIIRSKYLDAEAKASTQLASTATQNWNEQGEYIGSRWNVLSVLYMVFMATPALVGLFAWLSYGKLWGVDPFYM